MNTRVLHPGRRRARQRGQVVPIVAICAVALLGGAALAIDLSMQTHDQRTLQNVTDAGALAGAVDLPVTVTASNQYQGAQDALQVIRKRMGWQSIVVGGSAVANTTWAADLATPCSPANNNGASPSCNITKTVCSNVTPAPSDLPATCDSFAALAGNAHFYSVTIQTPAITSNVADHGDLHFFEITMSQDNQNYIAGVIGRATSTEAARSTAYHFGANQPFGFALFAKSVVQTQNKSTLVVGDVYADRNIQPQSSGQAGFCASGGLVVLGAPQDGVGTPDPPPDGQAEILPHTASPIQTISQCGPNGTNTTNKGTVNETRDPTQGCGVAGTSFPAVYDTDNKIRACVANPSLFAPGEPAITETNPNDSYTCVTATAANPGLPGKYSCNAGSALTLSSANAELNPGVYHIFHNPACNPKSCYDVDISASTSLSGVTLWLESGATIGVHGNGTTVSIDPAPPLVMKTAGDGRYPIYAPVGPAEVWVSDNGANLDLFGTMYIPDGTAHTTSNAFYQIDGQAIVGTWDDQGGNHATADITYNGQRTAPQNEVLKLVE